MKKTKWIPALLAIIFIGISSFKKPDFITSKYYIIISKTNNTLTLYDKDDWIYEYPCTFGNDDLGDKMMEGDKKTPEGIYKIIYKKPHAKWNKMLMLDYPNETDKAKFSKRKQDGKIPAKARIGGGIAIHGTWRNDDRAVDELQNWTEGCISMFNADLNELYNIIEPGTQVIIKR